MEVDSFSCSQLEQLDGGWEDLTRLLRPAGLVRSDGWVPVQGVGDDVRTCGGRAVVGGCDGAGLLRCPAGRDHYRDGAER